MGKRIVALFEILITVTLFAMFSGIVITTRSNEAIVDHTEEFVELVRYKGCITQQMYNDFLNGFDSVVDVKIAATRKDPLGSPSDPKTIQFTKDIVGTIESTADHVYPLYVGDEFDVVVRRPARSMYSTIVGSLSGQYARDDCPVIAIKGGMILNEQYH